MNCPYCAATSRVVDSRPSPDGTRRRRACTECKRRFTTYERLGPIDLKVIKCGDRVTEAFEHDKLMRALARVCAGRPIGRDVLERVARHIEAALLDRQDTLVASWEIAEMVLARLTEVDGVAHARFAADYIDERGRVTTGPRAAATSERQLPLFDTREQDDGDDDG